MRNTSKSQNTNSIVVRKATRADGKAIVDLIAGLAKFERLKPPDANARARLVRDIFDRKLVNVFVAAVGGKLAGYALYFYTYSSFLGKSTLFLEDIFVQQEERRRGVGKALFLRCVREANRHGCGRMKWEVLTWNRKAMDFYEKLGAERVDDLRLFCLNEKSLRSLSQQAR